MRVSYTVGVKAGEGGVGGVTKAALDALKEKGYLKQQITLKELPIRHSESFAKNNSFDILAAMMLKKCDILHSWNGFCYTQFLKAEKFGAKKVLERQSSHAAWQNKIMKEEKARFKIKEEPNRPYMLKKCVKEYELADRVLVPSQHAWDTFLEQKFPEEKLYMIPNGVDLKKFKPQQSTLKHFRVLFIGGNWLRKGWVYAERAFAQLNLPNSELWSAGPNIRATKRKNVKMLGFTPSEQLYNKCDIFVLPTLEDEMPLVVLEAMACGKPVITTPNAGCEEIIQDGKQGFIVPIRDEKALKEKMRYCFDNPKEIKRMGKNARKTAEKCPWERYKKKLINLCEAIHNG